MSDVAAIIDQIKTAAQAVKDDPEKYKEVLDKMESVQANVLKFVQTLKTGDKAKIDAAIKTSWPDVDELYQDSKAMDAEIAKGPGVTTEDVLDGVEKGISIAAKVGGLILKYGPMVL